MATALSDLETRLLYRLGIDTASALEANRIREALNAAISKVASEGQPGISDVFSAQSRATVSLTVSAHTANTSSVTFSTTLLGLGIFPGDWFEDSGGTKYMVHSIDETTDTITLGSPVLTAITGTVTCYRTAIELPHAGQVIAVRLEADSILLGPAPRGNVMWGFETGDPVEFSQRWSESKEQSYISLYPASTTAKQVIVQQSKFRGALLTSTNYNLPEVALNAILEEARKIHLGWSGEIGPVEAQLAMEQSGDFSDGARNAGRQRTPIGKR